MGGMDYGLTLHEVELIQEWNAAIEAAAKECDEIGQVEYDLYEDYKKDSPAFAGQKHVAAEALASCARRIRALKKEG